VTLWEEHGVEQAITTILQRADRGAAGRHLGRPYMTGYQLAIELDRDHRQVFDGLNMRLGGAGIGEHHSVAQYLARELSQRIAAGRVQDIEGAALSNLDVEELQYRRANGDPVRSSLTEAGYDLAIFRLR
jgi:hypothetical protein